MQSVFRTVQVTCVLGVIFCMYPKPEGQHHEKDRSMHHSSTWVRKLYSSCQLICNKAAKFILSETNQNGSHYTSRFSEDQYTICPILYSINYSPDIRSVLQNLQEVICNNVRLRKLLYCQTTLRNVLIFNVNFQFLK